VKIAKYCVLFLLLPILAVAQTPRTSVLTTLDGTESPLSESGNWTGGIYGTGECQKSSGVALGLSGTEDCYWTSPFGSTQEVFVTLPNATSHADSTNFRLHLCIQQVGASTNDGYAVRFNKVAAGTDLLTIERVDDGASTTLTSDNVEIDDGDRLWLSHTSAGLLTLYADTGSGWTLINSTTDTNLNCAGTNIGLDLPHSTHQADSFGGGTPASGFMLLQPR